jgi:hypothetical protein
VDFFWIALGLKAAATAVVVVVASVVAERVGPRWGGLVASIPVSAGPAYVLLALQHDATFIAASALSSFAAGVATWVFLLAFVRLSARHPFLISLPIALLAWLMTASILRIVPWTLLTALLANIIAYLASARWGQPNAISMSAQRTGPRAWYELPLRAMIVGAFVAGVVTLSNAIGPSVTGLAAVFPISLSSLAILVNRRFGISGAQAALAGAITPMIGIASGLAVLSLTPESLGTWPALGLALFTSLLWPMWIVLRHRA